jgi:hypothetical protein
MAKHNNLDILIREYLELSKLSKDMSSQGEIKDHQLRLKGLADRIETMFEDNKNHIYKEV